MADDRLPTQEDDIPIYEGEGGGPAGPSGPGFSNNDKAEMQDVSNTAVGTAAAVGVVATALSAIGAAPVGAGAGVVAAFVGFLGLVLKGMAADPPKPYERIVRFRRREFEYTPPKTELERRAFVVAQHAMFAVITGGGLLDAVERRDGAIQDRCVDWAIAHNAVARTAAATFRVDLATMAVAMLRLADEIRGTELDIVIDAERVVTFKKWFADPDNRDHLQRTLDQNGVGPAEVEEALALVTSDQATKALQGRTSELLSARANSIYDAAVRLRLPGTGSAPAYRLPKRP